MITIVIILLMLGAFFIKKKNLKKYFTFVAIVLSLFAFFIEPQYEMDLFKYHRWLYYFKNTNNIMEVFKNEYFIGKVVWGVYLFFISKLPYKGFLSMISVFIVYKTAFGLLMKISDDYNADRKSVLYSFCFFMLVISYGGVAYGIRNMLTFVIFARVLYIDIVKKKRFKTCFLIYLLLTQLHFSIIIFIILRIVMLFKNKYSYIFINIVLLFWSTAILPIALKLLPLIKHPIVSEFTRKINIYIESERFSIRIMYVNLLLLIMIIAIYMLVRKDYINKGFEKYNKYMSLVLVFTIGAFGQYDLFVRSVNLVVLLFLFYLLNSKYVLRTKVNIGKEINKDLTYKIRTASYNKQKKLLAIKTFLFISALLMFYTDYITLQKYMVFGF